MRLNSHPKYSPGGIERQMDLIGQQLFKKSVDVHFIINKANKTHKEILPLFSYIDFHW